MKAAINADVDTHEHQSACFDNIEHRQETSDFGLFYYSYNSMRICEFASAFMEDPESPLTVSCHHPKSDGQNLHFQLRNDRKF